MRPFALGFARPPCPSAREAPSRPRRARSASAPLAPKARRPPRRRRRRALIKWSSHGRRQVRRDRRAPAGESPLRPAAGICRGRSRAGPEDLRRGRARPRGVLGEVCRRARMEHSLDPGARLAAAARQVVRRRQAQCERELPGPARPRRAPQQGRDHLGGRARRPTHHHLLGPGSRGLPVRQRAQVTRASGRAIASRSICP